MPHLYAVSDLHIGPAGPLSAFSAGWEFVSFLRSLEPSGGTLLLNGDLFDFLELPGRPRVLDLERAPSLVDSMLEAVGARAWGAEALAALGGFALARGSIVVIPGNHDLELFHPRAEGALRRAVGLGEGDERLTIHREAEPWRSTFGEWEVVAGHGHAQGAE